MNMLHGGVLCVALMGATASMAQDKSAPGIKPRTAQADQQMQLKTDLVIESMTWVHSPPRNAFTVASDAARAKTVAANAVLPGPHLRVTVRNVGKARWASTGSLDAVVRLGTPDESQASSRTRTGASVVPAAPQVALVAQDRASVQPFSGRAAITGSLGPGESRSIDIALQGKSRNPAARKHLLVAVDKFYTAKVEIQGKGDDQPANNAAQLVFRLDGAGQIVGPMFSPLETTRKATVEVRAPKGR